MAKEVKHAVLLKSTEPVWKVHTPNLMKEILLNPGTSVLKTPLRIFSNILAEVAERASQLNDPKLNALMCRLAFYEISDPQSKDYDRKKVEDIFAAQGWA